MALRLTLILVAVIYLTMRFGGGPIEETAPQEIVIAPEPEAPAIEATQDETVDPAPELTAAQTETAPETPTRITLAQPEALSPAVEEDADASGTALDGVADAPGELITPAEALPNQLNGGGSLGLGGALDLRDQINAALDEAQSPPERPSLADLTRPGGGQTAAEPETTAEPAVDPDAPLAQVTATAVNLRGGPSTLNAVVGRVTSGEVLELRGEFSGGWAAVGHPDTGETVYISSQFLDPLGN